jgi:hypothetical protein
MYMDTKDCETDEMLSILSTFMFNRKYKILFKNFIGKIQIIYKEYVHLISVITSRKIKSKI